VPLVRDVGFGREPDPAAYSAAWALVYFLRKERPRQFATFLDLLRVPVLDPDPPSGRVFDAFRAAFGDDLGALESDWHRFMAGVESTAGPSLPAGGRDTIRASSAAAIVPHSGSPIGPSATDGRSNQGVPDSGRRSPDPPGPSRRGARLWSAPSSLGACTTA
jgi:hypothetical protein